jgi:two-component system OmpR family sensor kinase
MSIRRRLVWGLILAVLAIGLVAAGAVYLQARKELDALFDYQLQQLAMSVRDQAFVLPVPQEGPQASEQLDFVIQVWNEQGVRLYVSRPGLPLPERAVLGFANAAIAGESWRLFTMQWRGWVYQVGQPLRVRRELALRSAWQLLWPLIVTLPWLGVLVLLIVGRGFAPLASVTAQVQARTPESLAPLDARRVPEEVEPLVRALNDLLARLGAALDAQRRFVADAAHELRTPLAALQLQARLVERAANDTERAQALADLQAGLRRETHVVEQLLTLARQSPEGAIGGSAPVDLAVLARSCVEETLALADRKAIDLGIERADAATVDGDADALRILLRNLLRNAIQYTPEGGRVSVSTGTEGGSPLIEVCDSGPGIPAEQRERVFGRFYRLEGSAGQGTGLGLAIVQTIAERHGAAVELGETSEGGLRVVVRFPRAGATGNRRC